jgi:hypothetical protein
MSATAPLPALVQIVGTSKHSLLRHADFRPEAPRSRLQMPQLYDRRRDEVSLDEVERIVI